MVRRVKIFERQAYAGSAVREAISTLCTEALSPDIHQPKTIGCPRRLKVLKIRNPNPNPSSPRPPTTIQHSSFKKLSHLRSFHFPTLPFPHTVRAMVRSRAGLAINESRCAWEIGNPFLPPNSAFRMRHQEEIAKSFSFIDLTKGCSEVLRCVKRNSHRPLNADNPCCQQF